MNVFVEKIYLLHCIVKRGVEIRYYIFDKLLNLFACLEILKGLVHHVAELGLLWIVQLAHHLVVLHKRLDQLIRKVVERLRPAFFACEVRVALAAKNLKKYVICID
jgi:hypothetical protein